MSIKRPRIEHGFTWNSICVIILLGLIVWGIITERKVVPIINSDIAQIAAINDLKKVDVICKVHYLAGSIECSGHL